MRAPEPCALACCLQRLFRHPRRRINFGAPSRPRLRHAGKCRYRIVRASVSRRAEAGDDRSFFPLQSGRPVGPGTSSIRFVALAPILASLPVCIGLLGRNTANRDWAMGAIGLLAFLVGAIQVDAAIISWPA